MSDARSSAADGATDVTTGGAGGGVLNGGWRALRTEDGSYTLAHPVHGETCHSRAGAWEEARERYARACGLRARALEMSGQDARKPPSRAGGTPALRGAGFRLLDVGTGLGLNLAAALEALDGTGTRLQAVSLEADVAVIRATLELADRLHRDGRATRSPPDLERWHAPVRAALALALESPACAASTEGVTMGSGSLRLVFGDARITLAGLDRGVRFDAVFLDAFSPRVDAALWEPAFLGEIARRMAPGSLLSTYTTSLSVRAGLLAAGLYVGRGGRVGTKAAGTLASPDLQPAALDARTLRRLRARVARLP